MIRPILLMAVLATATVVHSASSPLAERKQPLSEAVEKVLSEFVQSCLPEKHKQLTAHMVDVIKTIGSTVTLTPEETRTLEQAAKLAVEETVKTWRPKAQEAMRTYLSRTSDSAAIRHIGMWQPEKAGPNEPVEGWTPPEEDATWLSTLKATLGTDRFGVWHAADLKARQQAETALSAPLESWLREARAPLNENLRNKIEFMQKKLELSESQIAALNKAAESLLDQLCTSEKKRATSMLLTLTPAARDYILDRSSFYISFDRPSSEAWNQSWIKSASSVLPADLVATWQKIDKEERAKDENEYVIMIKPSEQQAEQRMQMEMESEIDGIVQTLNLPKERTAALKQLSKQAVQESLQQARKGWLQQAKSYSPEDRKRLRGRIFFGINDDNQALKLKTWTEGLKKLLSDAEFKLMSVENTQRDHRTFLALARACLTEMDQTLMLTQEQRHKLEPLVMESMKPLMEQRRQQYWNYNSYQLFQTAAKVSTEDLRSILDEVQRGRWKEMAEQGRNSARSSVPDMSASFAEVQDMEAATSRHLYKMFIAERTRTLEVMMPQVEEAARLLSLPDTVVSKLTTVAKGAVESSLGYWRQTTESYVWQAVQNATPKTILQILAGTESSNSGGRTETRPQNTVLWKSFLHSALSEAQLKKLQQSADERQNYRLQAMAAMSTSEIDRRRRLTADQSAKVQTAVQKVLAEYLPDMERYMTNQWFLQYYHALVPVAGVPEKELQAILTPEQWKLCKDRDLPDALQYWEGIKSNHEQRMKRGGQAGGNVRVINDAIIFNND
ncbi:hypothetical protein HNQ65_003801 [Prosthecobacter vanneervenii]|uniref:Uncharacterized protein n=2 Tax=Prosthecobacter vanneervenii TaxID=48466 RepID=A0A7W7YDK8_9BACT|nr:hypothetical protein [Prosthecobacter vanneervenii]